MSLHSIVVKAKIMLNHDKTQISMCETPKMFCPRKFSLHPPYIFIGAFVVIRRCDAFVA